MTTPTKMNSIDGLAYGGDYNPEQWPRDIWQEDLAYMAEAGVTLVSVGIFSWAWLEPRQGHFAFGWLDDVLDGLAGAGIAVDLATATASPPPWFSSTFPETLPVTADGTTLWQGSRQAYCPSSPVYRHHAARLAGALASRYAEHPALAMWHVGNEYGCHVARCYCDVSAAAFRIWLQHRYGDIEALNAAWGTAFWSQRYTDWDQILPTRTTPTFANPTHLLDFRRFTSDELLTCYRTERDILRRETPGIPVTTNFMVNGRFHELDYWRWAAEVDVVTNDHYVNAADPHGYVELARAADMTRGLAVGEPWLLMEHSTSAVNWQPRNRAKQPGEMIRNSLAHIARGSEGAMFFQWRQSLAGAEQYHSGMVPHAGRDTKVWREVVQLGDILQRIRDVRGTTVHAEVAIVADYESWWALDNPVLPSDDIDYSEQIGAWYRAFWDAGVTVDFVSPSADLSGYRLVVLPTLYLLEDDEQAALHRFTEGGGTVVATFFSGIVDRNAHVRLGGYPGALRQLLGIRVEEFFPLLADDIVHLDDGSAASMWTELLRTEGSEVVAAYTDGPLPGVPAITVNAYGSGRAWYVATMLDDAALRSFTERLLAECQIPPTVPCPPGVEAVSRRAEDGTIWLFLLNHTANPVDLAVDGYDMVADRQVTAPFALAGGDSAVIRQPSR